MKGGTEPDFELIHALPGRLRLRIPQLEFNPELAAGLSRALVQTKRVRHAEANPLTATVLIRYDSAADRHEITECVGEALEIAQGKRPPALVLWWTLDPVEVGAMLAVTPLGLGTEEVARRRKLYGSNQGATREAPSVLATLMGQISSLPVLLLAASAVVSALGGAVVDALLIAAVIGANAAIGVTTERQANRIIEGIALQSAGTLLVRRDGGVQELVPGDVVLGDVLILTPGTMVPADARIIDCDDLSVDESALTGESLPVSKTEAALPDPAAALADRANMVFSGTVIAGGHGLAVVVALGVATELGQIEAAIGATTSRGTPLQRQLDRLSTGLTGLSLLASAGVIGLGLLRGQPFGELLRIAGALAVAAIPEGLPTTATVVLARGLREMQRQGVLIRHLSAVEALGSVTAICFDKTGTLTQNRMAVSRIALNGTQIAVDEAGRFSCDGEPVAPAHTALLIGLLRAAVLCNETEVNGGEHGQVLNGSSTETALVVAAMRAGLDVEQERATHPMLAREGRGEGRRYMTTSHQTAAGLLVAAKGNPNDILGLCSFRADETGTQPLDQERRNAIESNNDMMAAGGLRVLGFAVRPPALEQAGFVWLGMIGLSDRLRPGIRHVVGEFHRAGIGTIMLTGDQAGTARSIAEQAGIARDPRVVDGVGRLDAGELAEAIRTGNAFARITPTDKLRVVQALQDAGQVVAMTGDGSNDAPALRAADVGVTMAADGTALARETADILLSDDDLATMVLAVRHGRTIYANIRKSLKFLVGTNAGEVVLTLGAVGLGIDAPLGPAQLLWVNLLTDVAIAVALGYEPPEPEIMAVPPRDPAAPILALRDYRQLAMRGGLYGASALAAHFYGLARHGAGGGGIAFSALIGMQLLDGFAARSETTPGWRLAANMPLRSTVLGLAGLQAGVSLVPAARRALGLAAFDLLDLLVILAGSLLPYLAIEASKPGQAIISGEGGGRLPSRGGARGE